jgi:hypothetical protein
MNNGKKGKEYLGMALPTGRAIPKRVGKMRFRFPSSIVKVYLFSELIGAPFATSCAHPANCRADFSLPLRPKTESNVPSDTDSADGKALVSRSP